MGAATWCQTSGAIGIGFTYRVTYYPRNGCLETVNCAYGDRIRHIGLQKLGVARADGRGETSQMARVQRRTLYRQSCEASRDGYMSGQVSADEF